MKQYVISAIVLCSLMSGVCRSSDEGVSDHDAKTLVRMVHSFCGERTVDDREAWSQLEVRFGSAKGIENVVTKMLMHLDRYGSDSGSDTTVVFFWFFYRNKHSMLQSAWRKAEESIEASAPTSAIQYVEIGCRLSPDDGVSPAPYGDTPFGRYVHKWALRVLRDRGVSEDLNGDPLPEA